MHKSIQDYPAGTSILQEDEFAFAEIVPISAEKGVGTAELLQATAKYLPESPPLFDPDDITDRYGDLDHGHKALDEWQKYERQQLIHTLKSLDGPAQD